METASVASVVPGKNPTLAINLAPKGIAAPFGKYFVNSLLWMVAPDVLALGENRFCIFRLTIAAHHHNVRRDRAALSTIEPAVWSPTQRVSNAVRVLE